MAAPKGNKFALGHGGSKTWTTAEELKKDLDGYFEACDNDPIFINEVAGKDPVIMKVPTQRPYTIEGLATHLGVTRQTLLNYQKAEGYEVFFDVLTQAKQKITNQYITMGLVGGYKEGLIKFLLSNNTEYKDRQEIDHTISDTRKTTAELFPDDLDEAGKGD